MAKKRQTALAGPTRFKKIPDSKAVGLALTRLEAWVGLVDDVDPALAADELVVTMTLHQALERIANFHNTPYGAESPLLL
jgi:hypothetical protein